MLEPVFAQTVPDVQQFITDPPIALLLISWGTALVCIVTGKGVVPRFIYDREKERADTATSGMTNLTKVVEELTDEVRESKRS